MTLDALDVRLLQLLDDHPRIGVLELSRLAGVARATVTARMQRWQAAGIVTGTASGPVLISVTCNAPSSARTA